MNRKVYILSVFIIFVAIAIQLSLVYLKLSEKNPLTYDQPWVLDKTEYRTGEEITFEFSRCNNSNEDITYFFTQVFRNLETNVPYAIPGQENIARPGCVTIPSVPKKIPDNLPAGRYHYESINIIDTKLNVFVEKLYSVPFIIVATDSGESR